MTEFEFLQHFSTITTALGDSFMNYVAMYLAVLAALFFAGEKLPGLLLLALVVLFTLYTCTNLMDQVALVSSYTQAVAALMAQYGDAIPISMQTTRPTFFGVSYSSVVYPMMYLLSWSSVVGYAVFQYRVRDDGDDG